MNSAVCTLFEGDYHYGVGALVNSLYKHGFRGVVWAGYRGALPPWAKNLQRCPQYHQFEVAEGCCIRFINSVDPKHLNNYKPDFMSLLWKHHCPDAASLMYFDPDIVVKADWTFFTEWVDEGVAVCQDVNWNMPKNHPIRLKWKRFAESQDYRVFREMDYFYNGGFLGVRKDNQSFLHLWQELLEQVGKHGNGLGKLVIDSAELPYFRLDQDLMNLALMITPHQISTLGPDGMDFIPGGTTMSHAAGGLKPWRKRFLLESLSGSAPRTADKGFVASSVAPIALYSLVKKAQLEIDILCGAAVGRLIRKS